MTFADVEFVLCNLQLNVVILRQDYVETFERDLGHLKTQLQTNKLSSSAVVSFLRHVGADSRCPDVEFWSRDVTR